jgi:hypothetical protein
MSVGVGDCAVLKIGMLEWQQSSSVLTISATMSKPEAPSSGRRELGQLGTLLAIGLPIWYLGMALMQGGLPKVGEAFLTFIVFWFFVLLVVQIGLHLVYVPMLAFATIAALALIAWLYSCRSTNWSAPPTSAGASSATTRT